MNKALAQYLRLPWYNESGDTSTIVHGFKIFKFSDLGDVVSELLRYVFVFAGIGLLLMIISAGFSMLTSAGDSKKLSAGKQRLTNAVAGFLIIIAAYWLTQILGRVLGYTRIIESF